MVRLRLLPKAATSSRLAVIELALIYCKSCRGKKAAEERLAGREKRVAALEADLAVARAEAASLRDERAGLRHELSRMDSTHGNLLAVRPLVASWCWSLVCAGVQISSRKAFGR